MPHKVFDGRGPPTEVRTEGFKNLHLWAAGCDLPFVVMVEVRLRDLGLVEVTHEISIGG